MPDLADLPTPQAEIARLRARLESEIARRTEAEALAALECRALNDKQAELSLLATIARSANEANTLASAFFGTMSSVCQFTGWDLAHAFLVENRQATPQLTPLGIWYMSDAMRFTPFRLATEGADYRATDDIVGQVCAQKKSFTLPNLSLEPRYLRKDAAAICGLASGFILPICTTNLARALLECN